MADFVPVTLTAPDGTEYQATKNAETNYIYVPDYTSRAMGDETIAYFARIYGEKILFHNAGV